MTKYQVKRTAENSNNPIEIKDFKTFDKVGIMEIFEEMILNAGEGDTIEYCTQDSTAWYPNILTVEIVDGKPKMWTRKHGKKFYKEYKFGSISI
jgi:hypothetical protein